MLNGAKTVSKANINYYSKMWMRKHEAVCKIHSQVCQKLSDDRHTNTNFYNTFVNDMGFFHRRKRLINSIRFDVNILFVPNPIQVQVNPAVCSIRVCLCRFLTAMNLTPMSCMISMRHKLHRVHKTRIWAWNGWV